MLTEESCIICFKKASRTAEPGLGSPSSRDILASIFVSQSGISGGHITIQFSSACLLLSLTGFLDLPVSSSQFKNTVRAAFIVVFWTFCFQFQLQ